MPLSLHNNAVGPIQQILKPALDSRHPPKHNRANYPFNFGLTRKMRYAALACGLFLTGSIITGCASLDTRPKEERVADRSEQRWTALAAQDWERTYAFLSPGYRETTSLSAYRARYGGASSLKDHEIRSVECEEEDLCYVTVVASYEASVPRVGTHQGRRPFRERWILVDDEWWLFPRR